MLIKFSVANFLSFKDAQSLSMVSNKSNKLKDHLIVTSKYRILKSALLFGANASGKSNFIQAIDFARILVLKGDIKRTNTSNKYFRIDEANKNEPGVFQFDIAINDKTYNYGFALSYNTYEILGEWLTDTTGKELTLFSREKNIDENQDKKEEKKKDDYTVETELSFTEKQNQNRFNIYLTDFKKQEMSNLLILTDLAKRTTDINECNVLRDILNWFKSIIVIYPSTHNSEWGFKAISTNEETMSNFLSSLDTGVVKTSIKEVNFAKVLQDVPNQIKEDIIKDITNLFLEKPDGHIMLNFDKDVYLCNRDKSKKAKKGDFIVQTMSFNHGNDKDKFDFRDESDGTRRLFDLLPLLSIGNNNDSLILVDELDQSLHTKLAQEFYKLFISLSQEKKSQLIFTTHDLLLMNLEFVRQDEIWFIERELNHSSKLSSLSDYVVRCDTKKISDAYLQGRYGGIPILNENFALRDNNAQ